eukprot:6946278-Alexandrium_andersonii.AAC.1
MPEIDASTDARLARTDMIERQDHEPWLRRRSCPPGEGLPRQGRELNTRERLSWDVGRLDLGPETIEVVLELVDVPLEHRRDCDVRELQVVAP